MKEENINDIVSELRRDSLRGLASRIEAAAERERAELRRQLRNEIEINNALATVRPQFHYVDDVTAEAAKERAHEIELAKLRAPGNAAALREALTRIVNLAPEYPADGVDWNALAAEAFLTASAALAAPARNCDQFKTFDEARKAFQDLRGHKILADVELWDSMDEAGALVRWLFAPAEGGAE